MTPPTPLDALDLLATWLEKLAGKVAIEFGATELSVHATEK